jgi:hypothetical protein
MVKVYTITLGEVESSQVEELLRAEAKKQGLKAIRSLHSRLKSAVESADSENPVDAVDERELQEAEFMLSTFLTPDGFVKEEIEF